MLNLSFLAALLLALYLPLVVVADWHFRIRTFSTSKFCLKLFNFFNTEWIWKLVSCYPSDCYFRIRTLELETWDLSDILSEWLFRCAGVVLPSFTFSGLQFMRYQDYEYKWRLQFKLNNLRTLQPYIPTTLNLTTLQVKETKM